MVVKAPGNTCSCGRTFDIYEGGIRGRVDDVKVIRDTNVYPRAMEAIVREFEAVDEFQLHLYTAEGPHDELEVLVELPDGGSDHDSLLDEMTRRLSEAHEGLRIPVREVPGESLPRYELKAKRAQRRARGLGRARRKEDD